MEDSSLQLNDLPDEILMIIFGKLSNVELLHYLLGVSKRFNAIVCDPVFTSHLTFLTRFSNGSISPLAVSMLDRFCYQILPKIRHKIKWLNVEPSSTERILLATNYSNLYGLGLYDLDIDKTKHLFTDKPALVDIFKNQISSLLIDLSKNDQLDLMQNMTTRLLTQIFTVFSNLRCLIFGASLFLCWPLSFAISPPPITSSTLLELRVRLDDFTDCLYLLDGRFNQLRTLYVNISLILFSSLTIDNQEKLPNLRCFSLYCNIHTDAYVQLIVPLLHRMANLENLDLYLIVCDKETFVDGNNLKKNIINHMPQLNKFRFNIRSTIVIQDETDLPKNTDIQDSFKYFKNNQIISCVSYFPSTKQCQCHIYSYPYKLTFYDNITNDFPGGIFTYVREVSLYDERPFEHEFFLRIAESFPFMQELTIKNDQPQNKKRRKRSRDNNQDLSIIKYPHLTELILYEAHDDYVEQFLFDTKTCLPKDVYLYINYRSLKRMTHNFKRDATRINCSKINYCYNDNITRFPKHFKDYFFHADVV